MTYAEIIAQTSWTKTRKIQELLTLGFTRREVADLVTGGNYGFVQNVFAKMNLTTTVEGRFMISSFNKKFGIEIEAYNVNQSDLITKLTQLGIRVCAEGYSHTTRAHWKIVRDSSINGSRAFELVSPILQGAAGLEEVEKVCEGLKACNAYINKSCGMHIHFDAQEMSLKSWKNLYKNYAALETTIDSFMPTSRRANNNTYCKSLKVASLNSKLDSAQSLVQIEGIFGRSRYYKINPTSHSRHNTIEFRQHSGTVEFEKINNWIHFLHNLVDFSKTKTIDTATFENLNEFNQPEIVSYFHNRKQELAA